MNARTARFATASEGSRLLLLLALACGPGAGCSAAGDEQPPPAHYGHGTPALHAVQNERLRGLMQQMNALLFERMPTELELDQERRRTSAQIAAVADDMSGTVDAIIQNLPQLSLGEDEQAVFLVMANRLRSHIATLQQQAHGNYIDGIPSTMEAIGATCDGCHQLFRTPR